MLSFLYPLIRALVAAPLQTPANLPKMPNNMLRVLDKEVFAKTAAAVVPSPLARPLSESQKRRMCAAEAWSALSADAQGTWTQWAAKFRRYSPAKGRVVCPTARSLYIKAALDRWRLDPGLPTPVQAPETAFGGDEIGVFVVLPTRARPGKPGCVRFESTGANRPGVLTAILLQRLSRAGRNLSPRSLRPMDYVAFSDGCALIDLPVEPGHYAAAYRFVDAGTMQMGPVLEAGRVSIGVKRRKPKKPAAPVPEAPSHVAVNLARFAKLDVM